MSSATKQQALGFLLLIPIILGGGWLLVVFFRAFSAADKSVQASIIAAGVAVFSVVFTFWKERSRSLKEAHRDKKIEVYSQFYDLVFSLLKQAQAGVEMSPEEMSVQMHATFMAIYRGALFYGSPKVITAISQFKSNSDPDPSASMRAVGRVLLAMREDIGLSNSGLNEMNIHQIYVRDDISKLGQVQ
ncbi:hypothetical protein [Rhizobium sp. Root482]|uniref:hypothetical protein n=1 Tax=Rhizobium sp. Root482 TaxID=1736543 RepID=UPI0006FE1716|nr:hypothetical protein [Rhizobium sp. Root482]KQY26014.1 hypothetical protein ASD31_20590 [Rhizobium sp. Root482]